MNADPYIAAGIAALVSIFVSLVGFVSARYQLRAQLDRLEREIEARRAEKLNELRLKHYPKFFEISSSFTRPGLSGQARVDAYRSARDAIRSWRSGEPMLILSNYAIERIYELERALKANPENGRSMEYSQEQINKVWRSRQRVRGALRRDLGLLYADEDEGDLRTIRGKAANREG